MNTKKYIITGAITFIIISFVIILSTIIVPPADAVGEAPSYTWDGTGAGWTSSGNAECAKNGYACEGAGTCSSGPSICSTVTSCGAVQCKFPQTKGVQWLNGTTTSGNIECAKYNRPCAASYKLDGSSTSSCSVTTNGGEALCGEDTSIYPSSPAWNSFGAGWSSGNAECAKNGYACDNVENISNCNSLNTCSCVAHSGTPHCKAPKTAGVQWNQESGKTSSGDIECRNQLGRFCIASYDINGTKSSYCATPTNGGKALCGDTGLTWTGYQSSGNAECAKMGKTCESVSGEWGPNGPICSTLLSLGTAKCGETLTEGTTWSTEPTHFYLNGSGNSACAKIGRPCKNAYRIYPPVQTGEYANGSEDASANCSKPMSGGLALCDNPLSKGVTWTSSSTGNAQCLSQYGLPCENAYKPNGEALSTCDISNTGGTALCQALTITKTLQWPWNLGNDEPLTYLWSNGGFIAEGSGWTKALDSIIGTITYNISVTDAETGYTINDESTIAIGTELKLTFVPHRYTDVAWFGIGYSEDSPYGEWRNGSEPPPGEVACSGKDFVGSAVACGVFNLDVYVPLVVNPPAKSITSSPNITCDAQLTGNENKGYSTNCQVNSAGQIDIGFHFAPTTGRFYFRYYSNGKICSGASCPTGPHCYGNNTPLESAKDEMAVRDALTGCEVIAHSTTKPPYDLAVVEQTIPYTLHAVAAPVTATCSVSPASGAVPLTTTWTATASGGTGGYEYSWSGNDGLSGSGSGNPITKTYTSATPNPKTANVTVTDSAGNTSGPVACSNNVTISTGPINGACGSAHLVASATKPTTNLCVPGTGTPTTVTVFGSGSGPWNWIWQCIGFNGGTTDNCSAPIIGGACGSANGVASAIKPTTNLCPSGTAASLVIFNNNTSLWEWTCTKNGFIVNCSAPLPINNGCSLSPSINNINLGDSVVGFHVDLGEQSSSTGSFETGYPKCGGEAPATNVVCDEGQGCRFDCGPYNQTGSYIVEAQAYDGIGGNLAKCYAQVNIPQPRCSIDGPNPVDVLDGTSKYFTLHYYDFAQSPALTMDPPYCGSFSFGNHGCFSGGTCHFTCGNFYWGAPDNSLNATLRQGTRSVTCGTNVNVVSYINGLCGPANKVGTTTKPTTNLCATTGAPPTVSGGVGPWAWTCTGVGTGHTDALCSAPLNGKCGSAHTVATTTKPTANLCAPGTPTTVSGSGPWNWQCKGSLIHNPREDTPAGSIVNCSAPLNGKCGSAHTVATTTKPTANLCATGAHSTVSGTGPWNWTCAGSTGGATVPCWAPILTQQGTCSIPGSVSIPQGESHTFGLTYSNMGSEVPHFTTNPICGAGSGATLDFDTPNCTATTPGSGFCEFTCSGYSNISAYTVSAEINNSTHSAKNCQTSITIGSPLVDPITASCVASPAPVAIGQEVTWSVNNVSGGTGGFIYSWSGNDGPSGSGTSVKKTYTSPTPNPKTAIVTVTDSSGTSAYANCSVDVYPLPTVSDMNVNPDYCADTITFNWRYLGTGDETKFNFQIDNNSNFSSPVVDRRVCGTSSNSNTQSPDINSSYPNSSTRTYCSGSDQYTSTTPNALIYGETYYWRVKVFNSQGDSGWYYGGTTKTSPGTSFATWAHHYPSPYFTPTPTSTHLINGNANISFTDSSNDNPPVPSTCYHNNGTSYLCNTLTSATCTGAPIYSGARRCYLWWFKYNENNPPSPDKFDIGDTSYSYDATGPYKARLQICDDLGCCATDHNITIKPPLGVPEWKEISPF